jgi:hypothetical protein
MNVPLQRREVIVLAACRRASSNNEDMTIRRREFLTALGSAAIVWPIAVRAQQPLPVIGFLDIGSGDAMAGRLTCVSSGP